MFQKAVGLDDKIPLVNVALDWIKRSLGIREELQINVTDGICDCRSEQCDHTEECK
jgi:hypothetical protein